MTRYSFEIKRWARWLGTFIGFPLAGVTARLVAGNIDDVASAALGGLAGGAVLGAVQAVVGGLDRAEWVRWIAATAGGLAVGLTIGAGTVGFATDTREPDGGGWDQWCVRRHRPGGVGARCGASIGSSGLWRHPFCGPAPGG